MAFFLFLFFLIFFHFSSHSSHHKFQNYTITILQESQQSQDFITQESRIHLTSPKDHKITQQLHDFISQGYTRITKCSQDFISRCHSADIDSLSPISNSKKALFLFCCFLADCSFMLTRGIKTHRSGCTGCTIHDLRPSYSERDFKKIADYNHISKKKGQSPAKVARKQGATHSAQFPNPSIKK